MKSTSIYLAGPYQAKPLLTEFRDTVFEPAGIIVTSSWLEEPHAENTQGDDAELRAAARQDLRDVRMAEHFAVFSPNHKYYADRIPENGRGGRHVEFGYAWAWGKHCWMVGEEDHIFKHLLDESRIVTSATQLRDRILQMMPEGAVR